MLNTQELNVLKAFEKDCFYDYGINSVLWTDCFLETIEKVVKINSKIARGYLGQLDKKGYLKIEGKGRNSTVELTEKSKPYFQ